MAGFDLVGRLLGRMRDRDGRARALEAPAREMSAPGPTPRPGPRPPPGSERMLREAVATKLLDGWLSNRNQTLVPHVLNFAVLPPERAGLLVAVMAAAAQADGQVSAEEARRMPLALRRLGAGEGVVAGLQPALDAPPPLPALLAQVQEEGLAPHAYAAALLALDRRGRSNRAFLRYLAARLGLAPEVAGGLERRYRG
ncbi:DUF533 domain-containing protein [Rubellimicrobium aerolatum]|uniref:DUF533 domain-containing protein n=1 Tax=Rubellimicrobium aerolatum TaxID=490979 RepID=A0ABW0SEY6_9RHOB|nr:DUF533 domain-containing protein [Rubellimicrobium aerolatum]MBP1807101.1 uncharacterized membrane protein YebE (DUF533 family) [Rubellimicrobium aerolatum]